MSPDTAIAPPSPPAQGQRAAPPGLRRSPGQPGDPPFAALLARQSVPKQTAPSGKASPKAASVPKATSVPDAAANAKAQEATPPDPAQFAPAALLPTAPVLQAAAPALPTATPASSAPPKTQEAMDTAPALPLLGAAKPSGSELLPPTQLNTENSAMAASQTVNSQTAPAGQPPATEPPVSQSPVSQVAPLPTAALPAAAPAQVAASAQTEAPAQNAALPALKKSATPANNTGRAQNGSSKPVAAAQAKTAAASLLSRTEAGKNSTDANGKSTEAAANSAPAASNPAGAAALASNQPVSASAPSSNPAMMALAAVPDKTAQPVALAAQAAPPALTPAERVSALHQVADAMSAMPLPAAGGNGQMTLQLHPKDWGSLHLSVTMTPASDGSGTQIVAHVVAESGAIKDALEQHGEELRQALQDVGLHLGRLSVTVQSADEQAINAGDPSQAAQNGFAGQSSPRQWDASSPQSSSQSSPQGGSASLGDGGSAFSAFAQQGQSGQRPPQGQFGAESVFWQDEVSVPEPVALSVARAPGHVDVRA